MTEIDGKSCFSVKKIILTSKPHAEHLFAGGNTQQARQCFCQPIIFEFNLFRTKFGDSNLIYVEQNLFGSKI